MTYGPDHFKVKWSAQSGNTTWVTSLFTITCHSNTFGGPDIGPGPDLGTPIAMNPLTFSSCTDSLGGTDTVTVNATGWTQSLISESTDPACPAGTGNDETTDADCLVLGVPQNSTSIVSTALPCTIVTTPQAGENVGASVADPGTSPTTFTLTNQPVPFTCGTLASGTANYSGTYTLKAPDAGAVSDDS